jgi:RNA polymerase sigma factor (sigma-70 family)
MIALEDIIRDYGAGLGRVAAVYEADRSLQEDLLQETLLAIHRALPNLRDTERLPAFVFRIAHNRGVTHVVRERSARRPQLVDETEASTNPEEDVLARDRARRLQAAVRRLPLSYRQVVALVLEDLSHTEIAHILGLSESNVAVRLNRAKAILKEQLDDG